MSQITIRPAQGRDFPQLLPMIHALAEHHGDTPSVTEADLLRDVLGTRRWLDVLVAEHEGVVAGYAALCPLAQLQFGMRGMDLHHLYVAPDGRGRGTGRALIHAALAHCADNGCRYMTVGTHPANEAAARLYAAAGFESLPPPGPRFRMRL